MYTANICGPGNAPCGTTDTTDDLFHLYLSIDDAIQPQASLKILVFVLNY